MRRLAKDTRNDIYGSRRDYQTLIPQTVACAELDETEGMPSQVVFSIGQLKREGEYLGFGAYLKPDVSGDVHISAVENGLLLAEKVYSTDTHWLRVGAVFEYQNVNDVRIIVQFSGKPRRVLFWGIDCDAIYIPPLGGSEIVISEVLDEILKESLCPETFYLPHQTANNLPILMDASTGLASFGAVADTIMLKKCPYCNRQLPVDMDRRGSMSFDRHAAKRTLHQNECRACKKWRINNSLNSRRTKDQLHESSSITREKKILLREPEILARIKERHSGRGLKSIIWERFNGKCFKCNADVTVGGFQLDHTRPLAFLWPLDEHATCLCSKCNNEKHDKFPIDFYSFAELERLAVIVGLSVNDLSHRHVNEVELSRVIDDIGHFADEIEPRTFASIAYHVKSVRPDIDLMAILKAKHPDKHLKVKAGLARPESE